SGEAGAGRARRERRPPAGRQRSYPTGCGPERRLRWALRVLIPGKAAVPPARARHHRGEPQRGGAATVDPPIRTRGRRAARLLGRPRPQTTDAALLGRLARRRDAAAFSELLNRHGPSVWALCRRLVRTEADAEDVFQATFLVLARDAARVRKAASVRS